MTTQNAWDTEYPDANGELVIGNTGGRPLANLITEGTNVTVVNTAGGIDIQTSPINDLVVVQRDTASNTTSIDYTCRISDFHCLYLVGNNHQAASTGGLGIQVSTDGGSTWDTTASNYRDVGWEVDEGGSTTHLNTSAAPGAKMQIVGSTTNPMGTGANETSSFIMTIWKPSNSVWTKSASYVYYNNEDTDNIIQFWGGQHRGTTAVDGLRLKQTSGNIGQGDFVLYGVVK